MTGKRFRHDANDATLDRMVHVIVDEVDPEQVILFGSRARGDAAPDSDVDLIVVKAEPFGDGRSRRAEAARLYRALAGLGVSKDILVYSRDDVEYWRDSLNHVLARALREGKLLYERQAGLGRQRASSPARRPNVRLGELATDARRRVYPSR